MATVFTGIVEELGSVRAVEQTHSATRVVIDASVVTEGTKVGDSIAVNGCCLTVVELGPGWWAADAVSETLGRTNLGRLEPGDRVNLERPLAVGDRVGGHLVQGHVDGVGEVLHAAPGLCVGAEPQAMRYLVPKGSVTVDGVSLTVVSVERDRFTVAVIPHTMGVTTLGLRVAGDAVNLEVDVIAKYTERLLHGGVASPYAGSLTGGS